MKNKSFHLTFFESTNKEGHKWYQFTKMDRRELGYTAVLGLLAGGIFNRSGNILVYIIGDIVSILGFISLIFWIYFKIKGKENFLKK